MDLRNYIGKTVFVSGTRWDSSFYGNAAEIISVNYSTREVTMKCHKIAASYDSMTTSLDGLVFQENRWDKAVRRELEDWFRKEAGR